jgi:hypothetical protein
MTRPIRDRLSQLLGGLGVSASGDDFSQNVPNPAVGTLRESTRRGPWKRVPVVFSQSTSRGATLVERDGLADQEERGLVAHPVLLPGARAVPDLRPAWPDSANRTAKFRKQRLALSNAGW